MKLTNEQIKKYYERRMVLDPIEKIGIGKNGELAAPDIFYSVKKSAVSLYSEFTNRFIGVCENGDYSDESKQDLKVFEDAIFSSLGKKDEDFALAIAQAKNIVTGINTEVSDEKINEIMNNDKFKSAIYINRKVEEYILTLSKVVNNEKDMSEILKELRDYSDRQFQLELLEQHQYNKNLLEQQDVSNKHTR